MSANSATAANTASRSLLLGGAHHSVEVARLSLGVAFELARLALLGGLLGGLTPLLLAVLEVGLPLVVQGPDQLGRDLQLLDDLAHLLAPVDQAEDSRGDLAVVEAGARAGARRKGTREVVEVGPGEVVDAADDLGMEGGGISDRTLERAKRRAGIRHRKQLGSGRFVWCLPDPPAPTAPESGEMAAVAELAEMQAPVGQANGQTTTSVRRKETE